MRVVSADLWEPTPGRLTTWDVVPDALLAPAPAPMTYNQRNHLLGAAAHEPSVWITAAFDVDGPVDIDALEAAFRDVVAGHPGLWVEAVRQEADVGLVRHDPAGLSWRRSAGPVTRTVEQTRDHLVAELDRRCAPFGYPAFLPAALSRPDRSTVVLGMDHLHTDAWSTTVLVDELARAYAVRAAELAPDGVGAARVITQGPAVLPAGAAGAADVGADDPRLATWHGFLRDRGWALPTFPLPLGVPDGARLPQRTVVRQLVDGPTADAVAARARTAGASTSAAVLATLAASIADLGGPDTLSTLLPVHTRADAAARRSVGWHTTTVPLRVEVGSSAEGGAGVAAVPGAGATSDAAAGDDRVTDSVLAATGKALRGARELAAVPLQQVVESLPSPLRFPRVDIFQVSYLDYRRLPGHTSAAGRRAHHVSAATRADDLQVWVSRTDEGIAVRARMPHTTTAVATIDALLPRWSTRLKNLPRHPQVPPDTPDRT